MVARSPPRLKRMVAPLNPTLLRETVDKVEKCVARLQELQYTVTGGRKVISGVSLSPRSTRVYMKTSLRCKQESARIRNATPKKSPPGSLPTNRGEWRRMSLPAMLLGETVGEILQASQFAKEIVATIAPTNILDVDDPKTPLNVRRKHRPSPENSELRVRRKREKQTALQSIRLEADPPRLQRAKSRINFKISPPKKRENDKENCRFSANRVSPRHKPWAKKAVLFPNPMFHTSPTKNQQNFYKTKSPVIARNRPTTPHKFLIKSPASASKFQVKIKSPPLSLSPTRPSSLTRKSPKISTATKLRRSFSPSRLANKLASPLKSRKSVTNIEGVRRSFSPSRLANKLVSPLRSRKSVNNIEGAKIMMSGLKQRPSSSIPMQFSSRRI
ncbi:microtubule-binding protein TANGLED [Heracleum sosnowskyi]|uniref:Microtubule-binding protein TANGLED n=1 Tax=Heracleum sosnowskyi TaxID=360622 RepID=A0AAD8HPX5_9APIA|nr:microtubule-binding protein TANGLED [Heracleum sosnowskyi]